jgi:hypothetical protein
MEINCNVSVTSKLYVASSMLYSPANLPLRNILPTCKTKSDVFHGREMHVVATPVPPQLGIDLGNYELHYEQAETRSSGQF